MSEKKSLLFEIGVEELPTKAVKSLSKQLKEKVAEQLLASKLEYDTIISYGSPRRLAILVKELKHKQADYLQEKKGPAIKIAFDEFGNPTKALEGFAKANQVLIENLVRKEIDGSEFMFYQQKIAGKLTKDLIPQLLNTAVNKLMISKPMHWGSSTIEFVRPVHWITLLLGDEVIETEILGVKSAGKTYGHRFHAPNAIELKHANNYADKLKNEGFVIASFKERKKVIHNKVQQLAQTYEAIAVIDEGLLNDVTALVEWPVSLLGEFDEAFLKVPEEALISAMQTHQKVFHLINKEGNLLPKFITIANIESKRKKNVIAGNERVMRARLADAAFFFETDCKVNLEKRVEKLKNVIFQKKLGTLFERTERISKLASIIAEKIGVDIDKAKKAGYLSKADLVSHMVEEFPELQGTMGYHYALQQGIDNDIAMGIRGQYMPRFSGDNLPGSSYGCIVSLADRLDKLVGIFGINQPPSGEKDPFALRRSAIGLINIIIEKHYRLDLKELLISAAEFYEGKLINCKATMDVYEFIMERLKYWYQAKNIKVEWFNSVVAKEINELHDFDLRLKAVQTFSELKEAEALTAANKRVINILSKEENINNKLINTSGIAHHLLLEPAEKMLFEEITYKQQSIAPLLAKKDYTAVLQNLSDLRKPIDQFFDEVMVMVEDAKLKQNRIALLLALRNLFLEVADISKL